MEVRMRKRAGVGSRSVFTLIRLRQSCENMLARAYLCSSWFRGCGSVVYSCDRKSVSCWS